MHPDTIRRLEEMKKRSGSPSGMSEFFDMMKDMAPKDRVKPKTCKGCGREGDTGETE